MFATAWPIFFMFHAPLEGKRHVTVTARRTKKDWARVVRELVDVHYPRAEKIVLVMDNLNTHTPASLYETFPTAEAKRIVDKLEIHHTPEHCSWLNMAGIESGVLGRQCLDRRIGEFTVLEKEVAAWEADRNASKSKVNWQFTHDDARVKLVRLYPSTEG